MYEPQQNNRPSPQGTIEKLEAFQRCHGNYLPNLEGTAQFRVDHLISQVRIHGDDTPDEYIRGVEELLVSYQGTSVQAHFEQKLRECLGRDTPAASDIVEGLCSAIALQSPVYINLARVALESVALSKSDFATISEKFFSACAPFLAPGATTPPEHFAHSFLQVALLAKAKELA